MNEPNSGEEAIFHAASEIQNPAARAAYVQQACGHDSALRQRVEALLDSAQKPEDFLERPVLESALSAADSAALEADGSEVLAGITEQPGDHIGPYHLLERIGEGGCGVVYLAEQEEPIRRRVALKVVKFGMDTREVIARFAAERQALALMDHPNIAKALDAGATVTGRPYFVMELVPGTRITDYCDQHHLSTRARLDLFVKVCQAIQHAHQKGIIHRDIKPSNILVTLQDGEPVPKVIDFGIAKATGLQRLTDQTVFTGFRQFIGTPAYMSPEQAEMSSLDVDTRSDIYSLGVLLYELLTGRTPFDAKELLAAGLDEMRLTIRQKEPLRPSTRLSTLLDEERTVVASHRQTYPIELIYLLRGDLDWIAMKCLEKDRTRRYSTANGLATDIQRHLNNEPVVARPASRRYLLQKLVVRNKGTFAAVGAVAVALIAGLATSTFLYLDEAKVRQAMSREAKHARSAEADAVEKLRMAYLAQAQAEHWSHRAGRRFEGLELLRKAAAIRPSPELRNEAIACMALSDVRVIKVWNAYPTNGAFGGFDANYERYVFGDAEGIVHVARVADGTEIRQFRGYEPPYDCFEFSPDGRFLSVACGPGYTRIDVLDLNRKEVFLRLPQMKCRAIDFSADSRLVAVSYDQPSSNYPVRIFDLALRKEVSSFDHGSLPYYIKFHPKQSNLLLTSDGWHTVRIWDVEGGRVVQSFLHPLGVQGICWHPDGQRLATACNDGKVRLWEAASGNELAALPGHQAEAVFVAFSHDGEFLASRGWDDMLRLWNPSTQRELVERPAPGHVYHFSRAGNQLGVNLGPGRMALLDVASGLGYRVLGSDLADGERTISCTFSSHGRMMVLTHKTKVCCWDVRTGQLVAELAMPSADHFAVRLPDEQRLFLGTSEGVDEWSLTQSSPPRFVCERARLVPLAPQAYIMTLSQDGQKLAVSAGDELQIIDTQSGRKTAGLKPPYAPVFGALSSDGHSAVTYGRGSTNVQIWDVVRSNVVKELPAHLCNYAAFSPNNRWLVVGNVTEFRVWDVATWQSRYTLTNEASGFYGYSAFSPDSQVLAVGISRTAVRLVEPSSGKELATLEAPERRVINWITFNPDGTQLAVALLKGPIQLWDLRLIRQQLASMNLDWEMPPYPRKPSNQSPGLLPAPILRPATTANAGVGSSDGLPFAARFNAPSGVAVDNQGNIYVADQGNNTIRKVTSAGVVITLAGRAGSTGGADGTGSAAQFNAPTSIAVDSAGNVYVADIHNHTIRKVTPAGVVTTLAGLAGSPGSADGTGSAARFKYPAGVAVDSAGNVYVADTDNYTLRKITSEGVVTTLAGLAGFNGCADGTGSAARLECPSNVALDDAGNVYVADPCSCTIRKVTPAGVVTTLAGQCNVGGSADGVGSAALFNYPHGLAVDSHTNIYVADWRNCMIRKITPGGVVTTVAGTALLAGSTDGVGSAARFDHPRGVAVDSAGNVFVADEYNNTIRKITPNAKVSTLAGRAGGPGS